MVMDTDAFGGIHGVALKGTATQAAQSIDFIAPATPVTYGVKPIALKATSTSGLPVTFSVVSGPANVNGSTLTITGVGTVAVAASQAGNADYAAAAEVKSTITVAKASLTVTANNLSKVYGAALPTLTDTVSGFVNGDTAAKAVTGAAKLSTTATAASPVGTYPITAAAGTLAATNYSFKFVAGTLTVKPLGTVATPALTPPQGTYSAVQSVSIKDTTSGAVIYYTTNGDTPTTGSTKYSGEFPLQSLRRSMPLPC